MLTHRAPIFLAACFLLCGCQNVPPKTLRIGIERPPSSLNPRQTLDAIGQRLSSLIYRGLTRIDTEVQPQPDLADRWEMLHSGKLWRFHLKSDLKDHSGERITPERVRTCLENYRIGRPSSAVGQTFRDWNATRTKGSWIELSFGSPHRYLDRDASLLRYFVVNGVPCAEPGPSDKIIGSGPYKNLNRERFPDQFLDLEREGKHYRFVFTRDPSTLLMQLIQGDLDASLNAFSHTKRRWLLQKYSDRFEIRARPSINVTYLAMNTQKPILRDSRVRQAIALAIDRKSIVQDKLFGYFEIANSFISPLLPDSTKLDFKYDPERANQILDTAGYARDENGTRFELVMKTTPNRIGNENAQIFREQLKKIGIKLALHVLETPLFFKQIRQKKFELYSARWIGIADGSILESTLHSAGVKNRAGYRSSEMDRLIEKQNLKEAQKLMLKDLPYFPLWFWDTFVVIRKDRVKIPKEFKLSIAGDYAPLLELELK